MITELVSAIFQIIIAKLLKKDSVVSQNVSWIFHAAPIISFAASLIIGGILVVISYYLIQSIRIISELSSLALSASMSLISSDFSS